MTHLRWLKVLMSGSVVVAALMVTVGAEGAQVLGSLVPLFGDGKLVVAGEGYRAGERITVVAKIAGTTKEFPAVADGQGRIRLDTGLSVPQGSSVELEARGAAGDGAATITSVAAAEPLGADKLDYADRLPRAGTLNVPGIWMIALAFGLGAVGLMMRRICFRG